MTRQSRSEVAVLLQEARALELLADEAEVSPARLEEYWRLTADLINVVADIETLELDKPNADYADPQVFQLKRRLREIASTLMQLERE
ncbi:MAG TPA: hypothetical protein VKX16_00285 [Chloroflexota bacterium]|nr:hypothetical protein [Chloroflexota bacterium]